MILLLQEAMDMVTDMATATGMVTGMAMVLMDPSQKKVFLVGYLTEM